MLHIIIMKLSHQKSSLMPSKISSMLQQFDALKASKKNKEIKFRKHQTLALSC